MELGLKDRVAVVTGGSKGIGKAIALGLASEGVHVVLLARHADALNRAADDIRATRSVRVVPVAADIRDMEAVHAAADTVRRDFGTIHIVVNNAGGPIRRQDRQINWPAEDWVDDVNTKTIGMLRVVQAFLPMMARDGSGRVINISGIAATSALGAALTHGINNAAMNQVTSYLCKDLAAEQITVNAIMPGLVGTEWREQWADTSGKQHPKGKQGFVEDICRSWGIISGRWATVDEISDAVVFLASDRARYINGARIPVDGGYSINSR